MFCALVSESDSDFCVCVCVSVCLIINNDDADISPLLAKSDDPKMAEDPAVLEVVRQLDKACTEAGFFYVVNVASFL